VVRRGVPDEASRLYLRLAYSLDRRSRKKDGTRLVPWDLDPVRLPPLKAWSDFDEAYRRLASLTREMPNGFRREWLQDHLPTLRALIAMVRGRVPDLPHQVREFYALPARAAREQELESLRARVRRVLHVSRNDEVRAAVEAWERAHRVPADAVLLSMDKYLRQARQRSRKLFDLPRTERVRLVPMHRSRNSGYCLYTQDFHSRVTLNTDLPWTWPALRDMAAHEAYPGHHVHQTTREFEYLQGAFPREAAVSMAADPMGPVEEGLAENGLVFIHWDRTKEDRLTLLLNRLRWGTEVNLAWMVHREEPRRELMHYAMHSGLVDWQQALRDVKYARNRAWASYAFCYWYGTAMIRRKYESMDGDPAFFDVLYWKPYTVRLLEKAFRRL
jgi:hypothetical protein